MIRRKRFMIPILMLLVFVSNAYAITYDLSYPLDVPWWLTGKFCIAIGEEVLRADEDLEWIAYGQQVLCLNFDERNYTRTKVPDGSYLTQAPGCRPMLVYPDIIWSPIEKPISMSIYYDYVPTEPEAYFYILQPYNTDSTDLEKYAGFQEGILCNLPECFKLLGFFLNDEGDEASLKPHQLIVYNIKDNTCSELTSLKGEPLRADDMIYGAEISQSGVLAFMSTYPTNDGWTIDGQLTFLNTKNGEAYNTPLWNLIDGLTCADEYDRSWYNDHMRFCWVE
ncbi:MAG: hypothetical protein ACOYI8_11270 [Christensenellales bacterium]